MKLFAIFLSALYPFIMISSEGVLASISQYWDTPFQPLFIFSNIICSYFFFTLPNWRIPSFFLVLLTCFSWCQFGFLHDMFALTFYFACLHSLWRSKRFMIHFYLFALSISIYFYSILLGEIISIFILCGFHLRILLYKEKLKKR